MNLRPTIPRRFRRYLLCTLGVAATAWLAAPWLVPLPPALVNPPAAPPATVEHPGLAAPLPLANAAEPLPDDLAACTLAAEDKRFFTHGGVDYLATARATRDLLAKRRVISGASTITQQLIKITSPPAERNALTKLYENCAARRLESQWTKPQILAAYLNRLDYGNSRIGARAAARFYFQKPLAELSLAECALLAGLPQAPSRLNPLRYPQRAVERRNIVLRRLAAAGTAEPARISAALAEPLSLPPHSAAAR